VTFKGKNIGKKRFQSSLWHHSRSREWLMVNCVVNVIRDCLLGFYIFKGGRIRDDYIILCKANTCMAMQTKALMTFFLFKFFLPIFKKSVPSEIFQSKTSPNFKWAWITCYIRSNCISTWIWFKYGHLTSSHIPCSTTPRCKLFQAIQNYFHERKKQCNGQE